ncbi:hypothetical protein L2E82_35202 [Cichorium intybus]|uniref:Uncharacterized protein n=1 Tax=Cichorium intybus TaxID=13427 RepID=A0ACB9BNR3_CICIN|nr:hypothetical protein L2E82_35202 [Cichorium intybus]
MIRLQTFSRSSLFSLCVLPDQATSWGFDKLLFAEEKNSSNLKKMGVISRRVLPLCSICCVCCPTLRARSRHPVKRYKTLLAEIFPRSQDGEPNERKIGKLCEYASKNPLRIPKITDYLEQKFYKNLRSENITSVKVVLLVYGRLLSSCKTQMPLFASSFLAIVGTLLEQTQQYEMQILGCHALVNFINNQVDSAYMFNLEGLVPKLCQLAEEVGDDERTLRLKSAGLEVLAYMVRFIGEQPHVSMNFKNIISVTLENYADQEISSQQETNPSFSKPQDVPPLDANTNPSYWAQVCLHNMAQSAKEVTSVRHVLEPLFHKFDTDKLWLPEKGVALSVLRYLQMMLEESDDRSHLLLAILVKHIDHKDVMKQPILQLHIVNVATQLSKYIKQHQGLVSIVGAIADLIKHLRKCLHRLSKSGQASDSFYIDLQCALENCISTLSCKVGDVGPILDTMAVLLEKLPISAAMARPSISALYRTAQVISSIPNITYSKKAFPEALFHHLLLAMSHPDHETRLLAHRVFSIVLIPSLSQPWSIHDLIPSQAAIPSIVSQKVETTDGNKTTLETIDEETRDKENDPSTHDGNADFSSMRLSGHQVSLLLTSIWIQATTMENTPANFEAMAHTYTLALSFILAKNSNHVALLRFFQLAFSLRSISLSQQGGHQASQRRPLFMLASYMIIVSAKACHLPELISMVRSTLTEETVDPYLVLDDDIRLQAICTKSDDKNYGSQGDESFATNALSAVDLLDQQLKDTISMHLVSRIGRSSVEQISNMKAQLSQCFLPDDEYPLGAPPHPQMELQPIHQVMPHAPSTDVDGFSDQSDHKSSVEILSVNQLLESVAETASDVESMPDSSSPAPYDQIKNQCEALVTGKQQKMSVLQTFKEQHEAMALISSGHHENHQLEVEELEEDKSLISMDWAVHVAPLSPNAQQSFQLPPLSPYDKFLKAARH